jgi:hypothetical protein
MHPQWLSFQSQSTQQGKRWTDNAGLTFAKGTTETQKSFTDCYVDKDKTQI